MVWIIGRVQTNGAADYDNVHKIQAGMQLKPLSEFNNKNYQPPLNKVDPGIDSATPPPEQVRRMNAVNFFKYFTAALKTNPPPKTDAKILAEIKALGIVPGQDFDEKQFTRAQLKILDDALSAAKKVLVDSVNVGVTLKNGWSIRTKDMGKYGNNYELRAIIALWGLGANLPEDAIYPATLVDSNNQQLTGKNKYILHFTKADIPPVKAFWSLTLYNPDGYFVPNSLDRHALGDRDKLHYEKDGGLTIYIQHDNPGKDNEANWLPAPDGDFNLLLRLYWPEASAVTGTWTPPAVKKV